MAIMVVAMAGMVFLVGIASVAAGQHEPSATRNFNPATVAPGGRVTVTIQVANYGGFGRVTETLPAGFAYVSSTHDSAGLNVNGQEVRFTLQGDSSVAYTVTASRTAGSHSFSGMLRDSDRTDHPVGGPSSVQVGRPSPPPPPPPAPSPTQNRAPAFPGSSATRSVDGNSASGANVGAAVTAMDADGDTLTYALGGTDAASFAIDPATGQLMTLAALDFETKPTYSVTVTASDSGGLSDSIDVTITVTNVDEMGEVTLRVRQMPSRWRRRLARQ